MQVVIFSDKNMCRTDVDFQEFCLQVLFECVSKDRPALLQVIDNIAKMNSYFHGYNFDIILMH